MAQEAEAQASTRALLAIEEACQIGRNDMANPTVQRLTFFGDAIPATRVQVFLGDGHDVEHSQEWISAQWEVELPPLRSMPLQRIVALQQLRTKVETEIERLQALYAEAERVHG